MTAPDWHERWRRLREFVEADMKKYEETKNFRTVWAVAYSGDKQTLSEMARLEKEK